MGLKAVLFDFNGIIINDESIHEQLIAELLLTENLRSQPEEIRKFSLGRSDRACLTDLLTYRGRVVSNAYLDQLIERKSISYRNYLEQLEQLPLYPGLRDLLQQLQAADLKLGIVTGALRAEVELVLTRSGLKEYFPIIVAGDEIILSKPEPLGYLLGLQRLNQAYPELNLQPSECLALEDTYVGIMAARRAGIQVVGVAHTYPLHMLQRWANWAVDRFGDLELERMQKFFL
ncbi:HAD-superfamily hydrolase, subfamily IA, variant 3 [Planktothrix sp. PCC 11201]|uniref:HAD family hydrolase n=1 Tax=Planktothrix sp. PCC 11201 TaxID=1729650 RepID=UPI0009100DAE|nr:HAD family phosphatase [Planktothrix sp. PCC 11201]SKB12001.1 HAD-superfamily hydrolase, subfamily IA, variant 3 [Planktothrix sp. PCC 11201]